MVIGQYSVKVGEKVRVAFPKRFRQELGEQLIITYGFEGSLIIVSQTRWQALLEGSADQPFILGSARDMKRYLLGGAMEIELDAQGRFIIPEYLRQHAGIDAEIMFIGLSTYVEVWDKKRWDEYQKDMNKRIETTAEELLGRMK